MTLEIRLKSISRKPMINAKDTLPALAALSQQSLLLSIPASRLFLLHCKQFAGKVESADYPFIVIWTS